MSLVWLFVAVYQRSDLSSRPAQVWSDRADIQAGVEILHDNFQEAGASWSCSAGHEKGHGRCKLTSRNTTLVWQLFMAGLCNWGWPLYFCRVVSSFYLSFFPRLISAIADGCVPYFDTWCGLSANLECRSETCCSWLAVNTGRKKSPSRHHCVTLSGYIFATKPRIDNPEKNLLNSNTPSTCPHNMVNFGLLPAEICWRVWGTPANFNGFRVLAALMHGTLLVGISQTLRHWTEGTTCIRQGGHDVGHWPTFLVSRLTWVTWFLPSLLPPPFCVSR